MACTLSGLVGVSQHNHIRVEAVFSFQNNSFPLPPTPAFGESYETIVPSVSGCNCRLRSIGGRILCTWRVHAIPGSAVRILRKTYRSSRKPVAGLPCA